MPAPAVLLDEDTSRALERTLRQLGYDVVSVHSVGPKGVDDALVLEQSIALSRMVVTHNADDYRALHASFLRTGRRHPGILCVPQRGSLRRRTLRVAMMLDWIATQPYESGFFAWGHLQQMLEGGFRLAGYSEDDVRYALGWA
jgi:hypothetical protein